MRIVYPSVTPMGLGNNLLTVAKAYLVARSCKMTYQPPLWPRTMHVKPPTKNGYGYYFPSTVADKIRLQSLSYLFRIQRKFRVRVGPPVLHFDRDLYEKAGVVDVGEACLAYLKTMGLDDPARSVGVIVSGMWGGYASIKRARAWLHDLLLSHADTRTRLEEIERRTDSRLRVGIQIRMGDFKPSNGRFTEGERVVRIPLDWFIRVCRKIREVSDCNFILVTDGTRDELLPFLEEIKPINYLGQPYSDLLGILLISHSDLVVCSNSTYSRLACFLNDKPYVWFADTLVRDPSRQYGYLWRQNGTPLPAWLKPSVESTSAHYDAIKRCFPLSYDFSVLPEGLQRYLASKCALPIEVRNDLLYGEPVRLM